MKSFPASWFIKYEVFTFSDQLVTFDQSELNIVEDLRYIYLYEINTVEYLKQIKSHLKFLYICEGNQWRYTESVGYGTWPKYLWAFWSVSRGIKEHVPRLRGIIWMSFCVAEWHTKKNNFLVFLLHLRGFC